MADLGENTVVDAGRAKHLTRIAKVFYHRGATWREFGTFLRLWMRGEWPVKGKGFHLQDCRHSRTNSHGRILSQIAVRRARSGDDAFSMFAHPRYFIPCLSFGKGDDGKAPGVVVSDLCSRARVFLKGIGKGEVFRDTLDDEDYEPNESGDDTSETGDSSGDEVDPASLVMPNRLDAGPSPAGDSDYSYSDVEITELDWAIFDPVATGTTVSEGFDQLTQAGTENITLGLDLAAILDIRREPTEVGEPMVSQQGETQDTEELGGRKTTKMRVATLAYLCKFADDPSSLRSAFHRLIQGDECVLHLCGCGIKTKAAASLDHPSAGAVAFAGCIEPSHLKLGTPSENFRHLIWHRAFTQARVRDYPDLVRIAHNAPDGAGLF